MAKKVSDLFGHGAKHRSKMVKMAKKGHDFGKKNDKNTGFDAVARKAGGGEKGKRIAAAAFWKKMGK